MRPKNSIGAGVVTGKTGVCQQGESAGRCGVVRLVLFDIDGTLIRSGGAGVRAFGETFAEVFALPEATKFVRFCGRTDVSLVLECFVNNAVEPAAENFARFFEAYPVFLERN